MIIVTRAEHVDLSRGLLAKIHFGSVNAESVPGRKYLEAVTSYLPFIIAARLDFTVTIIIIFVDRL